MADWRPTHEKNECVGRVQSQLATEEEKTKQNQVETAAETEAEPETRPDRDQFGLFLPFLAYFPIFMPLLYTVQRRLHLKWIMAITLSLSLHWRSGG